MGCRIPAAENTKGLQRDEVGWMRQEDVRHKYGAEGHVRPQCYCTAFENINKSVKADSLVPRYLLEFFAL